MKRAFALVAALAFTVAACGDDGPTGPDGGGSEMAATIDGTNVTFPSLVIGCEGTQGMLHA